MTDQEQQRACAELDGHSWVILNYNTYDAIIPLIQKQSREAKRQIGWFTVYFKGGVCDTHYDATPAQLREALLRSTDRWID